MVRAVASERWRGKQKECDMKDPSLNVTTYINLNIDRC